MSGLRLRLRLRTGMPMTAALAILAALAGACALLPWSARRFEDRYSHAWDDKGDW